MCGDHNRNLPYWTDIPMGDPGIVSFSHQVDLVSAIKHFGNSCIIAGSVEATVIHNGTPAQVYELSQQSIDKAKYAPRGFLLTPSCGLPPQTPPYNVFMMKKAVDDFGWY